jgi:hypothetical protein
MDDDDVNAPWVLRERLVPSFQTDLHSCNARELQEQCSCLLCGLACNQVQKMLLYGRGDLIDPDSGDLHIHIHTSLAVISGGCVDNGDLDVA